MTKISLGNKKIELPIPVIISAKKKGKRAQLFRPHKEESGGYTLQEYMQTLEDGEEVTLEKFIQAVVDGHLCKACVIRREGGRLVLACKKDEVILKPVAN